MNNIITEGMFFNDETVNIFTDASIIKTISGETIGCAGNNIIIGNTIQETATILLTVYKIVVLSLSRYWNGSRLSIILKDLNSETKSLNNKYGFTEDKEKSVKWLQVHCIYCLLIFFEMQFVFDIFEFDSS